MEGAPTLRPLRVGEILDVCINIFTRNFLTFVRIVLVVVIPLQIVSVVVLISTVPNADLLPGRFGSTSGGRIASGDVPAYLGGQVVVLVLAIVLNAVATAACFRAVGDAYLGSRPEWRSSVRFAARRFHSVIWVTVLVFILSAIGLLGLIVTGIWLWFSFAVAVPALLFEGCKGMKALRRSMRLVQGRWWATAGAVVSGFLISSIVGGIFQGLISALVLTDAGKSLLGVAAINAVASGIGQVFTTPFAAAVTAVVYYDLRVRKEGFDLQLLADRLGVTPQPAGAVAPRAAVPPEQVPVWERQPVAPAPGGYAPPPPPPPAPPPPPPAAPDGSGAGDVPPSG
jgi:hypothetical protein